MSSSEPSPLPSIDPVKCTDCRRCIPVCPHGAILEPLNICYAKCVKYCMTIKVDCHREKPAIAVGSCDGCGLCIEVCPAGAIDWIARLDPPVEQPGIWLARYARRHANRIPRA